MNGLIKLPRDKKDSYSISEVQKYDEFPYNTGCSCCTVHDSLSRSIQNLISSRDDYERALVSYLQDIGVEYDKAIGRAIRQIASKLSELNNPSLQQVNDIIVFNLLNNWQNNFGDRITKIIQNNIDKFYRAFRADTSIFRGTGIDVPESTLSLTDIRTMDYMANIDQVYLGRFITDVDTRRRVTNFIREQHIAGNLSGNSLTLFREQFADLLKGEDWKISRIISTTMNKMRSAAALNYMQQAEVDTFEIRGIPDRLQCPYCRALQGFQFNVTRAMTKLEKTIDGDPNIISATAPFVTAVFRSASDMAGLSADQLQDLNIDAPPFHPQCRDRIIAVV